MAVEAPARTGTGYLRFLSFGGWIYAAVTAFATVFGIVGTFILEAVEIRMPVAEFWPKLYPTVELDPAPAAQVVSGGFTWAEVSVTGLGYDARTLLALGHLAQGATGVVIALAIALLCRRILAGDPFRSRVSTITTIAGASVLIGGLAWQLFYLFAGTLAARATLSVTGWSYDNSVLTDAYVGEDMGQLGWPQPPESWFLDFWPVWIGLALLAVAAAFRHAEKLTTHAEQLAVHAEELERDTEGLI